MRGFLPHKKPIKEDIGELHPSEIDLILTLRHEYKWGDVEINMRDGLPYQLLRTVRRRLMGDFDVIHNVDLTKEYPELYNKRSE